MRRVDCFNADWCFMLKDNMDFLNPEYQDADWRKLNLPHDWSIEFEPKEDAVTRGGAGYTVAGTGWYRKHFNVAEIEEDKKYYFFFEGIYMDSTVYLNGEEIGGRENGYMSFYVDATKALKKGENVIAVRVDNSLVPNSRWYSGSGIYRDVYMVVTNQLHFDAFGVRCATNGIYPEFNQADFQIRAAVKNDSDAPIIVGVRHELFDVEGNKKFSSGVALNLKPGEVNDCMVRPCFEDPHLWTVEDPYLYILKSYVLIGEEKVDEVVCKVGVRTAEFDKDKGFLLNGKQVKLKGVCLHQDTGLSGAVIHRDLWVRRFEKLKDMGCNAIRCAHNIPAPVFLDLCDEMGFLVMDEFYDEWFLAKNKTDNFYSQELAYGSSMFFEKCSRQDTIDSIRRDFNHPSIIMWSIGNEIPEQSAVDGPKIIQYLQGICHEEDPTRAVTLACDNIVSNNSTRTRREFENELDVVGYNYMNRWKDRAELFFEPDRNEFPNRRFIGSESHGAGGVRGDYEFGREKEVLHHIRGDYSNVSLKYGAAWRFIKSHDYVSGDFIWTGIDYLGESVWPARGCIFAPMDTAAFEKDTFYFFRSIWNEEDITLYLAPNHWNFQGEEGQYRPVVCYTNCDEVVLYLNDKMIGHRGYACPRFGFTDWDDNWTLNPTTNDLHLLWDVMYEPGVLRAEGYKDGKLVKVTEVATTGAPENLVADLRADSIQVNGVAQIELSMTDQNGLPVGTAEEIIECKIEGPAHLIGMDSGSVKDLSNYSEPKRKMFAGLLFAAIQGDEPGTVQVEFKSESGKKATVEFEVI